MAENLYNRPPDIVEIEKLWAQMSGFIKDVFVLTS